MICGGGTRRSDGEYALLNALVAALPDGLRSIVTSQFATYNLVQREQDNRALNFYRALPAQSGTTRS
jgi:hypothetical protein